MMNDVKKFSMSQNKIYLTLIKILKSNWSFSLISNNFKVISTFFTSKLQKKNNEFFVVLFFLLHHY